MKLKLTIFFSVLLILAFGQNAVIENIQKLSDQGKLKEAISLSSTELKKLKSTDASYKKIIRIRVDCYMGLSDFKSAINDWKTIISLEPKDSDHYQGLAYAYWMIGEKVNCLATIDKALDISPKDPQVLSNVSYYYGSSGNYPESIRYATIGLAQNNIDNTLKGSLLNNRGYAHIGLKKYEQALKDINESIRLFPDNSFAFCYRAIANIGLNKMETVCKDLEKAQGLGGVELTHELILKYCKK